MALVESLLTAIVRADGDALVMHVGEKPYVVASAGPIELSSQGLNLQAMAGMVAQLLPEDAQRALSEFGAVEHELPSHPHIHDDRFSVVVARGGDDVWIEVRRHRRTATPLESAFTDASAPSAPLTAQEPIAASAAAPAASVQESEPAREAPESVPVVQVDVAGSALAMIEAASTSSEPAPVMPVTVETQPEAVTPPWMNTAVVEQPSAVASTFAVAPDHAQEELGASAEEAAPVAAEAETLTVEPEVAFARAEAAAVYSESASAVIRVNHAASYDGTYGSSSPYVRGEHGAGYGGTASGDVRGETGGAHAGDPFGSARDEQPVGHGDTATAHATVIPMTRMLRIEVPPSTSLRTTRISEVDRLLALASARGATALYLTTQAPPHIRVDADIRILDGERAMSAADVETGVLELAPEGVRDALRRGEPTEWAAELTGIGPVRCSTFKDHRGPGAIFQLVSMRPMRADQLGLSPEVQSLATEVEGLVLVATPAGHGKTALVGALVDLINRQRRSYIITLEREIRVVHEHHHALISQRQINAATEQGIGVAQGVLRENPDVLVIEDVASAAMFQLALDAAGSGTLVFATVTAASTTAALSRLVELVPADKRRDTQLLLAERLRGAVAQVLLHNTAGGRVAARELLLATSTVTSMLSDGQVQDLPRAIEAGRKHGLVSLTDAFVQHVRSGTIDIREAYRKTDNRDALVVALKRESVDTAVLERLA